ncbi:metallophosphoesterase [Amphibacillus sp. MSJ-3]|uniref:metallophosphoesterase family protein n=1 Tax=Amphibacillus sp. MSJ-3 TaxID=2841505 RepID=UPI001C0EAADA|nr:metallophosphoesterase [Amphibacillus sp. MSJ-3]MBU5593614.1 metallophosphoesterase [Amphibacillus sp. MSJ-3]
MPKVLIVSDSHGWSKELATLKERYQNEVDQMIHCGDSELDYNQEEIQGFQRVAGNTDYDPEFPDELTFEVIDTTFYVAHGHMHNIKMTLLPITYRASEFHAKVICHGHSHYAAATRIGDQLVINPGSIRFPRGRREETYAILEWDDNQNFVVRFYQLNGDEVKDLAFSTLLD